MTGNEAQPLQKAPCRETKQLLTRRFAFRILEVSSTPFALHRGSISLLVIPGRNALDPRLPRCDMASLHPLGKQPIRRRGDEYPPPRFVANLEVCLGLGSGNYTPLGASALLVCSLRPSE